MHSSVDGNLDYSFFLIIMNTVQRNIVIQFFVCVQSCISFILEVSLVGQHNRLLTNIIEWMDKELVSNQGVHTFNLSINNADRESLFPTVAPGMPSSWPPASMCPNCCIFLPDIQTTDWNCRWLAVWMWWRRWSVRTGPGIWPFWLLVLIFQLFYPKRNKAASINNSPNLQKKTWWNKHNHLFFLPLKIIAK